MSANDPSLSNRDLSPTTSAQRTWGAYNYIALWFSMSMEITTYQLASSLIAKGMDWKQAVATVLLGNLIVLIPMLLNAHAGAKYGIPFPVFIRAPFGVRGANLPALLRAVVACGWFGIQSWIGGTAIHSMLAVIWPSVAAMDGVLWACFLGFWLLNMAVVWRGVESIRHLQAFGAPFMFVMAAALLIWVRIKAGSFGSMLSTPSQFHSTGDFLSVFFPSLTAMVGYWATLALNIPDFTRYSKSQTAQAWGQACGLPVAMALYTFVGIAVTSASVVLFGHPIWNPILLIGAFHQPVVAFVALIAILIATLNINIGANVVSPSNDFSNLYPRLISFRTGGLITGFLGLAMCPWKLLATPDAYIFGWLIGYSGLLGPVAGIMVCDYFLIRKTELDINSLYHREGTYHYTKGINPRAIIALVLGVGIALIGLTVAQLHFLYDYAWFVGFFTAGFVYLALMKLTMLDASAVSLNDALSTQTNAPKKHSSVRLGAKLTQNLALFFAFLATAFAGWSGYEAHKSRLETHEDTVMSLKLANRSYAVAEDPEVFAAFPVANETKIPTKELPVAKALEQQLVGKHKIKVYGAAPAFEVTVVADCRVGLIGALINKAGGITEADVKTSPLVLPSTMMPGSMYQLQENCSNPSGVNMGAVVFGIIHYKDVFGTTHYTHFCYDNPFIIPEALGNPDPKKWNQGALDAGKHMVPCENFNDADLPNVH